MAVELELPVPLEGLLKTSQVQVIETVDAGNLKTLLKWIVDKLGQSGSAPAERLDERLAAIENDNEALKQQLGKLQEAQAHLLKAADAQPGGDALAERVQALEERVKALEAQGLPDQAPQSTSGDIPPISITPVEGSSTGAAAATLQAASSPVPQVEPAAFEALQARVQDLEQKAAHGDRVGSEGSDGSSPVAGSGPAPALSSVLAALDRKANTGDLDALRAALANKADRSELDALAAAGGGGGLGSGAAPVVAVAEDGSVDMSALADGVNRALGEAGVLRGLLVLLQERVAGKADLILLDELRGKLSSLSADAKQGISPDEFERGLRELRARIEALELQLATYSPSSATASGADSGAGAAAVDGVKNLEEALPLIRDLYDKVGSKVDRGALDPLTRRLAELAAALAGLESRLGAAGGAGRDTVARTVGHGSSSGAGTGSSAAVAVVADPARMADMEAAMSDLAAAVRALQGGGSTVMGSMPRPSLTGDGLESALAALRDRLGALEVALAGKADAGAVEELKLRAALAGAAASMGGEGGAGEGAGTDGLLDALKDLLAGKANQAELDALKDALAAARSAADEARALADDAATVLSSMPPPTTPPVDLSGLEAALQGKAAQEAVDALAQQVGDLFGEVAGLRSSVAAGPQAPGLQALLTSGRDASGGGMVGGGHTAAGAGHAHGGNGDGVMQVVNALAKELQAVKDGLDLVAHASNLMAVGLEQRSTMQNQAGPGAGAPPGAGAGANGAGGNNAGGAAPGLVNGREPRNPRGAVERLTKLLGRQAVGHKMDWFDPDVLNKLATKMGSLDALLKGPAGAAMMQGRSGLPDAGFRDLELQLKRLARDVRSIKDKEATSGGTTARMNDGDHAMLSGKPLMGYRCMACDRPLDKLDERPGPHIPTHQMPVSVAAAPDSNTKAALARVYNTAGGSGSLSPEQSGLLGGGQAPRPGQQLPRKAYDPATEKRGPQNWYEDVKGPPAEALPNQDVGPKLPPGGWRGTSNAGTPAKSTAGFPDIMVSPGSKPRSPAAGGRSPPRQQGSVRGEPSVQDHAQMQREMLPSI